MLVNQGSDGSKRDKNGFNAAYYAKEKDLKFYDEQLDDILGKALKVEFL